MSGSKLHPIYVALDGHQYNRAIKLASALPDSNILGKALLAHAYLKSGQRYPAMVTLDKLLGNFCELRYEVEHSIQALSKEQQPSKIQPQENATTGKKGKKGKKKPAQTTKQQPASNVESESKIDLIDHLITLPELPENWETSLSSEEPITDETTLGTLSVTLQGLKLPLTAYQVYARAASVMDPNEVILTKTFSLGLTVLASPSKWSQQSQIKISTHVLSHMQTLALQWARLLMSQSPSNAFPIMLATSWASQTSLWQLQWLPKDDKRSMILPRLAESMARRVIDQEEETSSSAEIRLLLLRILEYQEKWTDMLTVLDNTKTTASTSDFGVALTNYQVKTEKARILMKLEQYDDAKSVYEELLKGSPDDWSCWKGLLDCCVKNECVQQTEAFVETILELQAVSKYPLRGPRLMETELAAHFVRESRSEEALTRLASSIESYGTLFASRASCAFSDLETYIELLLSQEIQSKKVILQNLLTFAETMRKRNASSEEDANIDNKERKSRLRAYIFAVKLNQKVLAANVGLQDEFLVDWKELVTEWQKTLSLSSPIEGEVTQKELKPGDDLALLAAHQLLYKQGDDTGVKVLCAALLEMAMEHSPDNAYLKVAAIDVYHQLDATPRSWKLFQAVGLKHIQLDSCTYTIIPYLLKGGLYNEAVEICNSMMRFHATTARDCGDYAGRAMDNGTLSKGDEFMVFQREKMNNSLILMEAKGLILDAAPLIGEPLDRKRYEEDPILKGHLGLHQGIVGAESDIEIAKQMITEVHNPYAALSLVSWADNSDKLEDSKDKADNRDTSILFHQILYKTGVTTIESIMKDSLQRGHIHGLLIRATLCLDATKGPKKGKIVKSSQLLEKRTKSLLDAVDATLKFINDSSVVEGHQALVRSCLDLCRVLAIISTGLPQEGNDSLAERESRAFDLLQGQGLSHLKEAKELLSKSSVKDVCSLLPTYLVPLFALFRICSNLFVIYGWGKRKRKSKKCAGGLADFAIEFDLMIQEFITIIQRLSFTERSSIDDFTIPQESLGVIEEAVITKTKELIVQGQYRTRLRVEPILQEISEILSSFDVTIDD